MIDNTGMLWYIKNHKLTLAERVTEAANAYLAKTGLNADEAHVNPIHMVAGIERIGEIEIVADDYILPNHVWVGRLEVLDG